MNLHVNLRPTSGKHFSEKTTTQDGILKKNLKEFDQQDLSFSGLIVSWTGCSFELLIIHQTY